MNKPIKLSLLISFLTLLTINVASAESLEFKNGDGSNKTAVCIASATSKSAWQGKAAELGISNDELQKYTCNGFSIEEFGNKYRNKMASDDVTNPVKVFAFTKQTKKIAADLCIAGSISNTSLYNAMKKTKTAKNNMYLVRCNGMSIKRFSKKFGNKKYRA